MKFIHLSDLHLGKRLNEFSMLEDQKYILKEIINIIDDEKPDGVFLAGDIYDKPVPSADAVLLFDDFLCRLSKRGLKVFCISGNHDSAERIAFGSRLMNESGIYMSPVFDGEIKPVSLNDKTNTTFDIYMLPYIKPAPVRQFFPDIEIRSYSDAVKAVLDGIPLDSNNVNILITHQFVTGAVRSESEEISVGGTDNVDGSLFSEFDYVALGHIHSRQSFGDGKIRYCGTPLKYSFSEANQQKTVTVVDFNDGKVPDIKAIPLTPFHDLREIKGTYMSVTDKKNYDGTNTDDYLHITLSDEEDIPDAAAKLRVIYKNLMKIDYDNKRTRSNREISADEKSEEKSPTELFCEFYEKQNNQPMTKEQLDFSNDLIEKIWGDEK